MTEERDIESIERLLAAGRLQEARDELSERLRDDPDNATLSRYLREVAERMETDRADNIKPVAETLADKLERELSSGEEESSGKDPGSGVDDERIQDLLKEGRELLERGDYQNAIDVWSRIYIIDLNHAEAQRLIEEARVALQEEQRKWDESLQEADEFLEAGDFERATAKFNQVLAASPNHAEALDGLDRVEQKKREGTERVERSQRLLQEGAKLYKAGKLSEAIYSWERVLELDPTNGKALDYLREARRQQEMPELAPPARPAAAAGSQAEDRLEQRFQDEVPLPPVPDVRSPIWKFLGIAILAGAIVAAVVYFAVMKANEDLDAYVDSDITQAPATPSEPPAAPVEDRVPPILDPETQASMAEEFKDSEAFQAASTKFQDGDFAGAATIFQELLTEHPDHPFLRMRLDQARYDAGVVALRQGDSAAAAASFQAALEIEKSDSLAERNLEAAKRYMKKKPDRKLKLYASLLRLRR